MPQFNFRLQKVLDIRKYKEEVKKQELAALLLEYQKEQEFLNYLKFNQDKYQKELREKQVGCLDIFELIFYYTYLFKLCEDIERQINILCKLQEQIDLKREEVIQVQKERKIVEKLKDKKWADFKKELDLVEQKFLDEIGINKFVRG
ncbi:MAG: hypothetical protein DDT22_01077 [candidate division WS2 bacterium]|nr:hypothetical protein [Candidatus Lithacetigena glycinireducens]